MRITRFRDHDGRTCYGIDQDDGTADLLRGSPFDGPLEPTGHVIPMYKRMAPVYPVNIFCIGQNYRRHAEETGAPIPEQPVIFMKPTTALNHPEDPVVIPAACERGPEVDYEVELAVVIGRPGRDISVDKALDHVLGYTVANDISARRWQKNAGGGQWIRGKSFDTFCPLGPVIVTPGDDKGQIADPQGLDLSLNLNGQTMQSSSTSDMIFSVAELIAFLSRDTTLLPGTVILTGTPEGVGVARDPKVFLKQGDVLEASIDGIGTLHSPVVAAKQPE